MKVKKEIAVRLKPKKYTQSLGARAMDEDVPRKMERSAYNYLDVSVDNSSFANASALDFSIQFQQFALFNAGGKSWDDITEILISASGQAKLTENPATHPVWIAMIRHAKLAPNQDAAERLLSEAMFKSSIDHKSWDVMPDSVKYEGLLFAATKSRDIPKRLKKIQKIENFFSDQVMLFGALLSLGEYYVQTNNVTGVEQALKLVKNINSDLFNLKKKQPSCFLFKVINLRFFANQASSQNAANVEFLSNAWQIVSKKRIDPHGHLLRYQAMSDVYNKRVACAGQTANADAQLLAHQEWQTYLSAQIKSLQETS